MQNESSLEILNSTVKNPDRLLDGDDSTCINPQTDMIWNQTLYLITVKILTRTDNGKLTARFSDTVQCKDRQVNIHSDKLEQKIISTPYFCFVGGSCGVLLVVACGFLPQNFGKWWGSLNCTLSFYECMLSSWTTHSEVLRTLKPYLLQLYSFEAFVLTGSGNAKTCFLTSLHLLASKSHLVKLSQHLFLFVLS